MTLIHPPRATIACSAIAILLFVVVGCSSPGPRDPSASSDPYALVAKADELAGHGDYDEALRDYLQALDHGREIEGAFVAARNELVGKIVDLGGKYPPARAALAERLDAQAKRIEAAADVGPTLDAMDLRLFVVLGARTGEEARVRATHAALKARLPDTNRMRLYLWAGIEEYLVEQRRYQEAVSEPDGSALVKFYLTLFRAFRADERVRDAIQVSIDNEGATHYEALLGAGNASTAQALADELTQFMPTAATFAALMRHARRAGRNEVAAHLRTKAYEVLPEPERGVVDDAMNK